MRKRVESIEGRVVEISRSDCGAIMATIIGKREVGTEGVTMSVKRMEVVDISDLAKDERMEICRAMNEGKDIEVRFERDTANAVKVIKTEE